MLAAGDNSCSNSLTPPSHSAEQAKRYNLLLLYLSEHSTGPECSSEPLSATHQASEPETGSNPLGESPCGQPHHRQQSLYSWLDGLIGYLCAHVVEKQLLLVLMMSNMHGCNTALAQVCFCTLKFNMRYTPVMCSQSGIQCCFSLLNPTSGHIMPTWPYIMPLHSQQSK